VRPKVIGRAAKASRLAVIGGAVLLAGVGTQVGTMVQSSATTSSTAVIATQGDINNFDPSTEQLNVYEYIKPLLFSNLVKFGPRLNILPDLATSWSVNSNATVFVFNIRSGATFQNGDPVNATAISDSLQHTAKSTSVFAPDLALVTSWQVVNAQTLRLSLSKPYAAFLSALADISIEAPGTYATARTKPVGSGPYEFVSWTPNRQLVLKAWPAYWGTKPVTQNLIFEPITDPEVALTDLEAGSVDAITSVPATSVAGIKSSKAQVVIGSTSNQLALFEFNSTGPLANVKVRQALAYALNKPAVQAIAYGGHGQSSYNPIPPSSWAYSTVKNYPYNLQKAKALLAQAGESNLSLTVIIPAGYSEGTQTADVWQQSLSQIGVTLHVDVEELSVWLDQYVKESYQITWNVFDVKGDPDSFYSIIMDPHQAKDFPNPTMVKLEAEALATPSLSGRAKIYAVLDNMVATLLPVLPIQTEPLYSVVRPGVTGWTLNPLGWPSIATMQVG
jgi:peptide/nickel transport system substrate-binding protein